MGISESFKVNQKDYGFRIYKLVPNLPLAEANLKIIEDFLIPAEEIFKKKIPFSDWVKQKAGQKLKMQIYSLKERKIKEIELQVKPEGTPEGLLGASVRLENMFTANKKLLHVIKVKKDSFSERKLGLVPDDDYLIAMRPKGEEIVTLNQNKEINPHDLFREMIKNNLGKTCEFYIYNKFAGGRCVVADIDNDDFFEMGCDVAFGRIHEFPTLEEVNELDAENKKLREESGETEII